MNNEDEITFFKKLLLERQAALLAVAQAGQEAAQVVELDQTRMGRLSRMDAMQQQAMSVETSRRRTLELNKLAAALVRLEAGNFGDCLRCDEPIVRQRLVLDPAATLCIQCAEKAGL